MSNGVEKALESGERPETGAWAVPGGFAMGVDNSFAMVGEDGLSAGVVDVEGD